MTDPFALPPAGFQPPMTPPQPYGAPVYGYTPAGYGYPPQGLGIPGYGLPLGSGPPGHIRGTGTTFFLVLITFGIYTYVYNYRVHSEMKRHSGTGLGGGIALLLSLVAGIAMPFLTPAEVGRMYEIQGRPRPVKGTTGLWVVIPGIIAGIGYVVVALSVVFSAPTHVDINDQGQAINVPTLSHGTIGGLVLGYVAVILFAAAGGIIWLRKTNGALNAYWRSMGVQG